MEQMETAREITNPSQNQKEAEVLINCRMWTTSPQTQILLMASLSFTSLKITKQWSMWSSEAEVQRWDHVWRTTQSCPWLVIWQMHFETQDPNQICWHQKPTHEHVDQRKLHTWSMGPSSSLVEHHEVLDVFQQPFFCKKGKQSVMSKRAQECTAEEGSAVAKPRYVSSSVRKLVRNNNHDPTAYSQERRQDDTLSSGTGKLVQSVMTFKSKGQGWNFTMCKSPTIDTLKKSSRTCGKSWISQKRHQYSTWRPKNWYGEIFWRQRWKTLFVLDQITRNIWKYTGTQTLKSSRICSITRRDRYWNMKPKFWVYHRLIGQLLYGRDLRLRVIK